MQLNASYPVSASTSRSLVFRPYISALHDYLSCGQITHPINLPDHGTEFQRRVWRQLMRIPAGSTMSYGELARQLDSGARAVANACRHNPIPLFVPCHRVVAANGIGGFMGETDGKPLQIKLWLLEHERRHVKKH